MKQFNAKGVAHPQRGGFGQKPLGEVPRLPPQAEQARLLWQMREQGAQLLLHPSVERTPPFPAQHLKHAYSHHFAWIKMRQLGLLNIAQFIVYAAKQREGKIFCGQRREGRGSFGHLPSSTRFCLHTQTRNTG